MRSPSLHADPPGPPRAGALYAVRFTDVRGQSVTRLFWRVGAADRFAAAVEARGGSATIYRSVGGGWSR